MSAPAIVAGSIADARALEPAWSALLARWGGPSLDPVPDFFLGLLDVLPDAPRPHVAVFGEPDDPRALLVARRSRARSSGHLPRPALERLDVVYGGLVSDGSDAARGAVCAHLRALLDTRAAQLVSIHHLGLDDPWRAHLERALGPRLVRGAPAPHWSGALLDPSTREPARRFSGKRRRKLAWSDRQLEKAFDGDVSVRTCDAPERVASFRVAAAAIGARSYQGALAVGVRDDALWTRLLGLLADSGRLRARLLVAAGAPIAYAVGAVHADRFTLHATAFLPEHAELSPGAYVLRRLLETLTTEGVATADFGFGDAQYKRTYGGDRVDEATLDAFGHSARSSAARLSTRAERGAVTLARQFAERTGGLSTARKRWRAWLARS